jgi:NTE family protein
VLLVASDMQGVAATLSSGLAVDAIMVSASVPGVLPLVEIEVRALIDEAVAGNTPVSAAARLGADRIVILPTGNACDLQAPPSSAVVRALHAVILLIAWQLMRELEHYAPNVSSHLVPALCPLDVSPYDFNGATELIARAAK